MNIEDVEVNCTTWPTSWLPCTPKGTILGSSRLRVL